MRHSQFDSSGPMQGQRSVFRVPNYNNQPTVSLGKSEDPVERVYHSRRTHRKSRAGCATCKQRRVKVQYPTPLALRRSAGLKGRHVKISFFSAMKQSPTVSAAKSMASSVITRLHPFGRDPPNISFTVS
ncbi:hypothetical protein VI817_009886 [Penicillium citrinum]|nr:hypothetical protein VI817_009886 [Penicillium citrinum]